jgi:hypothetical protein
LENVPLQTRRMNVDGMPPHFDGEITEYINSSYKGRWTG